MNRLVCRKCKKDFPLGKKIWRCGCGGVLDIEFKAEFPLDKIRYRKPTLWRYREAIPIDKDENIVSFDEGYTPLIEIDFFGKSVLIKQDYLFTTGSFKDRGASVLISKVKELGIEKIIEDSSGNAGSAIAAYCAHAGVSCEIYLPEATTSEKSAQIQAFGAELHVIPGSREDTAYATLKDAKKIYYASHAWNPFFLHGTKTFAYEICEQLGWKAPDTLILPVGNGTLLLGAYIGFKDLSINSIIGEIPKIVAVQSSACAPLARTFFDKLKKLPEIEWKYTIAEGIAIAKPVRGEQILSAVGESGGHFISVNDSEIEKSLLDAVKKGFFIEPTAAATIAGLKEYLPHAKIGEVIVSVFTGSGLKTTQKILQILQ